MSHRALGAQFGPDTVKYGAMTREQFSEQRGTYWHGTPHEIGGGNPAYGVHVGSHEAARQALTARIGTPNEGVWDGTREYGKTLLNRDETRHRFNADRTWTKEVTHNPPQLPSGRAQYSTGDKVPMTARPTIEPVRLVGPMTNTPRTPHEDFKANGYMKAALKKGTAKKGYFYTNQGEDAGSIAAVVPGRGHLATHQDYRRAAVAEVNKHFHDRRVPER